MVIVLEDEVKTLLDELTEQYEFSIAIKFLNDDYWKYAVLCAINSVNLDRVE